MLFPNGKMVVNGKASSVQEAKRRVRRYTRISQKMGWNVHLKGTDVQMISGSFKVEGPLDLTNIVKYYRGSYEPKQFPAVMFVQDSGHFFAFRCHPHDGNQESKTSV